MHQVLCHDEFEYEYEHKNPITPTGKKRMHQVLCHDEYEYERKEKYITKVLRVALKKKKKYITGVFVFKPCLFHSEGGLMFVIRG